MRCFVFIYFIFLLLWHYAEMKRNFSTTTDDSRQEIDAVVTNQDDSNNDKVGKSGRYHRLVRVVDQGFSTMQYTSPPPSLPIKAICLASVLFLFGTTLLISSVFLLFVGGAYHDRAWPLMFLGLLMFIPGAYHIRIVYYAFNGRQGFSFDDIPNFD